MFALFHITLSMMRIFGTRESFFTYLFVGLKLMKYNLIIGLMLAFKNWAAMFDTNIKRASHSLYLIVLQLLANTSKNKPIEASNEAS